MIKIGEITQQKLQIINPLREVILFLFDAQTVDAAGDVSNTYTQEDSTCRIQPVDSRFIGEGKGFITHSESNIAEYTKTVKAFYFLSNTISNLNRNISTAGDYIQTVEDGLYYRIVQVPERFNTGWIRVIGVQSSELGS